MLANSPSAIPEEHKLKETHSFSTRREKVRDILSKEIEMEVTCIGTQALKPKMFYFFVRLQCVNNTPMWTNLKPPEKIIAQSCVSESAANNLRKDGLPISFA